MKFKRWLDEVQTKIVACPDCEEDDCEETICTTGASKCSCRRRKVKPGKLDVTSTLSSGAVGSMKGAG